ncbi:hypothetical protein [Vampirovibrio sp.]|uniref:hypothetical protein n=1 Tax=Vampirovibrio sp. TaxID=2717857 RepID=UPI0035938D31
MEILLLGSILIPALFVGTLLLVDYVERVGATMQERKAIIFEIYRYAVCFLMVIVFGLSAFQLLGALIGEGGNPQALTPPALGSIISGFIFLIHWLIKNPALPASQASKPD